jgi:anti-sigma-K factor RskA
MIDERKEELAAMYALGIMEPAETRAFEAELRDDSELRKFVDDLLHCSAAMVHAVPAKTAPSALREKVLDCARERQANAAPATAKVVVAFPWLPWAIAAGLAIMCGWLGHEQFLLRNQVSDLLVKNDVCQMQVAMLNSTVGKQGVATVVWDSSTQTGVLDGENMPRPAANEDYQLWVIDDRYPQPVDAGVISVDANGKAKAMFKPKQNISHNGKFAVSIEKKGGMPQPEGPIVMSSGKK